MNKDLWKIHAVLGAIIVALGTLAFMQYQSAQALRTIAINQVRETATTADRNLAEHKQVKQLEAYVSDLEQKLSGNQKLFNQYVAGAKTAQQESQKISEAQIALGKLQAEASISSIQNAAANAASLWRPRLADVTCDFGSFTQGGSGTLFRDRDAAESPIIITNKHVITSTSGQTAKSCTIVLPDLGVTYTVSQGENMRSLSGVDLAVLIPTGVSSAAKTAAASTDAFCGAQLAAGTRILVMGYPSVGAQGSVTVTEGIISGYEDKYYTTSAKVEHGNSGGAVIAVDQKCYIGIPTFVTSGSLESLARVLDIRATGLAN